MRHVLSSTDSSRKVLTRKKAGHLNVKLHSIKFVSFPSLVKRAARARRFRKMQEQDTNNLEVSRDWTTWYSLGLSRKKMHCTLWPCCDVLGVQSSLLDNNIRVLSHSSWWSECVTAISFVREGSSARSRKTQDHTIIRRRDRTTQ